MKPEAEADRDDALRPRGRNMEPRVPAKPISSLDEAPPDRSPGKQSPTLLKSIARSRQPVALTIAEPEPAARRAIAASAAALSGQQPGEPGNAGDFPQRNPVAYWKQINAFLAQCAEPCRAPISDSCITRPAYTQRQCAQCGIQPLRYWPPPLERVAKDFKGNLISV